MHHEDPQTGREDAAVEQWLRDVAVPAADALEQDPTRARTLEDVKLRIAAERSSFHDAA